MGHGNAALRTAIALPVLVCLTGWSGELSASASGPSLPGSCVDTPTARCAIDLTIVTAEELSDSDADARAQALVRVAAAQIEAGLAPRARKTLERALTAANAIDGTAFAHGTTAFPEDEAFHARSQALAEIAQAFAKLKEPEKAKEVLIGALEGSERIVLSRFRAWSLVTIAKGQMAVGALEAARQTLARADLTRNANYFWDLYETVRMQAELGDVEGALVTARNLPAGNGRGRSLAEVADVQSAAGDLAGALVTAESIEHTYFRMLAVYSIGIARAGKGDIAGAWDAVGEIVGIWDRARDGKAGSRDVTILQADTVAAIMDAHLAAGRFADALEATEGISDDFAFIETHAAIAGAQIAAGLLNATRATADAMCRKHRYGRQCVVVLARLATAQASLRRVGEAQEILAFAATIAERTLLEENRSRAFLALYAVNRRMEDTAGAGQAFESAMTAANRIEKKNERATAFTGIAVATTRGGDRANARRAVSGALEAAAAIDDARKRVRAFLRVGLALREAMHAQGTRLAFSRAVASALATGSAPRRAVALADIGYALASGRLPAPDGPL